MKKLSVIFITVTLLCGFSFVQAKAGCFENCKSLSESAGKIMKIRQTGEPMSKIMERFRNSDIDQDAKDIVMKIIMKAYDMPHYSSEKYKERAINDFTNVWFKGCIENCTD